jgi:glucose/arabinose dehydrogenase
MMGLFLLLRGPGDPVLYPHQIHLQKGVDLSLRLPAGYGISVAYEGLRRLRFLTKSPDGRLFATDMYNKSDNRRGRVYVFEGWDSVQRKFTRVVTFLDHLQNPNQVAFYRDRGVDYIYVAETGTLTRYVYHAGDEHPSGKPDTLARFPDYGLGYKYGGWHLTRSLAFHAGRLYVSVGSSCNACIEKEAVRASVIEMNPDGSGSRTYAAGLRNSVVIKWVGDTLWATSMGRDLLGPDKPEDLLETVEPGKWYGWPYYFQYRGKILPDTAMQRQAAEQRLPVPGAPPVAWCGFKAHSAPLGFELFSRFADPLLDDRTVVALHGSTKVSRQRGNAIVAILGRDRYVTVIDGFLSGKTEADRKGRPCDILMRDARSFYFTDDHNGVLYYVWKE